MIRVDERVFLFDKNFIINDKLVIEKNKVAKFRQLNFYLLYKII